MAKGKLDVFILLTGEHFVVNNNEAGIEELVVKVKKIPVKEEMHIAIT